MKFLHATPSNSALHPPLAALFSAAYRMAKAGTQKKTNVANRDFSLSALIGERAGVRCRIQTAHATGNRNGAQDDTWWWFASAVYLNWLDI